MAFNGRIAWETLRSLAGPFDGTYQELGDPLVHPSYICKMVNNSTALVTISIDGVNDVDVCPAGSFWLYDEGKTGAAGASPLLPAGTQFYVKGTMGAGGTDSVYLVTQYVKGF